MAKFCIATDSGCDLPMSLCKERNIYPLQMPYFILVTKNSWIL